MLAKQKILVRHNQCGNEYEVFPNSIIKGYGCNKCAALERGLKIRRTHKQFIKEVAELYDNEYEVITMYEDMHKPVVVEHIACGNEVELLPVSFLRGLSRCPICLGSSKRKSHEEFLLQVEERAGNEYEVISEYETSSDYVVFIHEVCGNEFKMSPANFLHGQRCPKCRFNALKTQEKYEKEVFDLYGNEYQVLGKYTHGNDKIRVLHVPCGTEYDVVAGKLISGIRCFECFGVKLKTHEEFAKEVFDVVGDSYTVLSNYENGHKKLEMKHSECGHQYLTTPVNFLHGKKRCPECARKERMIKPNEFQEIFDEIYGEEYSLLEPYQNCNIKLKVRHNDCGREYEVLHSSILRGSRCKGCLGLLSKTTEQFKQEVFETFNDEYEVIGEYVTGKVKILVKHTTCEREYYANPHNLLKGHGCKECSKKQSKGEKRIVEYFKSSLPEVAYEVEQKFKECRNIRELPFDFYVETKVLIEYDGIQHFQEIEAFGGEEEFENVKLRDSIKNRYCIDNNIPLIRIPYWEFNNIDNILNTILNYLNFPTETTKVNYYNDCVGKYLVSEKWNEENYFYTEETA